jgi:ornithine cyclodeaminase/alanine dehydrogenase-like protein (mu-crystallin family)
VTLWLSESDVEGLVDPVTLVDALRDGFRRMGDGALLEPPAVRMDGLDDGRAYLTLFPAHDPAAGLASAKILAGRPANAAAGRPEIAALVTLADTATGAIVAIVSAAALTALRTAGVTALAIEAMAGRGPFVIGLAGTGAQARAHARVLAATGLAARFVVAAPRQGLARARHFAADIADRHGMHAEPAEIGGLAARCDVLVTMSLSPTPLPLGPLPPDLTLASVGPFYPHAHEIDPALAMRAASVVSDHPARLGRQWAATALEGLRAQSLGRLLSDTAARRPSGLRLFLSDGRGFEDNIAARLAFDAARRTGRGLELP